MLSLECWGGATFDVAMRFLKPRIPGSAWPALRERVPNLLLQMLLRGANGVGYKPTIPDNVVQATSSHQSAEAGIDLFRIFDSLNWVENMRVSHGRGAGVRQALRRRRSATAAISGKPERDQVRRSPTTWDSFARSWSAAGAHILGIKDMAGLLQARAAASPLFVTALQARRSALADPFPHPRQLSGISAASRAGRRRGRRGRRSTRRSMDIDVGLTSQPNLGSIAAALRPDQERDPGLDRGRPHVRSQPLLRRTVAPALSGLRVATCAPVRPRKSI